VLLVNTIVAIAPLKILALFARNALLMLVFGMSVWAMKQVTLPLELHPVATLIAGGGLCLIIAMGLWFFAPRLLGEEKEWVLDQILSRLRPGRHR
jgi:hypothetical protein